MTDTLTNGLRLTQPAFGGDNNSWGTIWNNNLTYIDNGVNGNLSVALTGAGPLTLLADGSPGDQARYFGLTFTGTLSASYQVLLPINAKVGFIINNTNQTINLNIAGQTLVVPNLPCASGATTWYMTDGLNALFNLAPTGNTTGVTNGSAAPAGQIGEVISSTVASGSALSLTSASPANITSISLSPGDWNVWGTIATAPGSGCIQTNTQGSVSQTSATMGAATTGAFVELSETLTTAQPTVAPVGMTVINVSTTTTVYLVAQSTFSGGTNAAYGSIFARRAR